MSHERETLLPLVLVYVLLCPPLFQHYIQLCIGTILRHCYGLHCSSQADNLLLQLPCSCIARQPSSGPSVAMDGDPHYLSFEVAPHHDKSFLLHVKAGVASGILRWELRRFVMVTHKGQTKDHYTIIGNSHRRWRSLLELVGLRWDRCFVHSLRSAKARGEGLADAATHCMVTTEALLLLLIHFHISMQSAIAKDIALMVAAGLISRCLNDVDLELDKHGRQLSEQDCHGSCSMPTSFVDRVATCTCVQRYVGAHEQAQGSEENLTKPLKACKVLARLVRHAESCQVVGAWARRFLCHLASLIDVRILGLSDSDPMQAQGVVLQGVVRKRAADPDLVEAMSRTAMENKKAKTSTALAKATGKVAKSTMQTQDERLLSHRQAAALLTFSSVGSCSLSCDASRLGDPAEDILFGAFASHAKGAAEWLPPQAPLAIISASMYVLPCAGSPCVVVLTTLVLNRPSYCFRK